MPPTLRYEVAGLPGDTVVTRIVDRERIRVVGETDPIDLALGLK